MPRRRLERVLHLAMNGRAIGTLTSAPSGRLSLRYTREWLEDPAATPISLRFPLSPDPYGGEDVASYFDNLLPDGDPIRSRMQRSLAAESTQPFDLLAAAGADCVGALQLLPTPEVPDVRRVVATRVSDADIARLLRGHHEHPLGMAPEEDDFRISLAGAQEKTAFLRYRDAWHRPHGPTPTTHLFKLPIGVIEANGIDLRSSVENEWLCLRLAAGFGLPVPKAEIATFEDVKVLVVERFDRKWSDDASWIVRLPLEDFCQALGAPPARKYESRGGPGIGAIMDVLLQSVDSHEDRSRFLRACIVYWLLAAIDGHAKNFSLFLYPGGRCRLAPFYDIVSAYPLAATRQLDARRWKMAMAVKGKSRHEHWAEIQPRHWITTAAACRFPPDEARRILEDCLDRTDGAVEAARRSLPEGFPRDVSEPILEGVASTRRRAAAALRQGSET
jgi:serine/threonine-protein kinase HipA